MSNNVIDLAARRRARPPRVASTVIPFAAPARSDARVLSMQGRHRKPAPLHPGLRAVTFGPQPSPALERAESIRLPAYVDQTVLGTVASGLHCASARDNILDHRESVDFMQDMAGCLPALTRDDIEQAVEAVRPEVRCFRAIAEELILLDQEMRGIAHRYTPLFLPGPWDTHSNEVAAAHVRDELAMAQDAGYIPSDLTYRVSSDDFFSEDSIAVIIEGLGFDTVYNIQALDGGFTDPARELRLRVKRVADFFVRRPSEAFTSFGVDL